MGQGPDLMSNQEHDDSAFCIFTRLLGNGWEKKLKKLQVRCIFGACCNMYHTSLGIDDCPEKKKHTG